MEITIRSIEKEDLEFLSELSNKIWKNTYQQLLPDEIIRENKEKFTIENLEWTKKESDKEWNLIELNGKIVGYFHIQSHEMLVFLGELYIDPDFQRMGLGKTIMNYVVNRTQPQWIVLEVVEGNDNAYDFYKKCGFEEKGKTFNTSFENHPVLVNLMMLDKTKIEKKKLAYC